MRDEGHIAPAAAPTLFVTPRARSYPPRLIVLPALVRTAQCSFVHMFFIWRPHLLPCARVYCSALAFTAYVLPVKQNIVSI